MAAAAAGSTAAPLTYLVVYRSAGLQLAVAAVAAAVVAAHAVERHLTGRSLWSILGLAGVVGSAGLALATNDAVLFFLRSVVVRGAWGVAFVVSAAVGRPMVGALFGWMLPRGIRPAVQRYRRPFQTVTFCWGGVELAKATVRGYVMATGSLEEFTAVLILTGWPIEAALLAWSIWYLRRRGVTLAVNRDGPVPNDWLNQLGRYRLIDLTTFRRDGRPVITPVRYAIDGDLLVVSLQSDSGKVKRASANPAVRVGGHPDGPARDGTLRFLHGSQARAANRVLTRRHRLLFVQRLLLGRHPRAHQTAEIRVNEPSA